MSDEFPQSSRKIAPALRKPWIHGWEKKFQRSWELTGKESQHEIRACTGPETVHWAGWTSPPGSERTELQPELHSYSVLSGIKYTNPVHSVQEGDKSRLL